MNQSMHSRLHTLSQFTIIVALLTAGLVIAASRLPTEGTPASPAATAAIGVGRQPAGTATPPSAVPPLQLTTASAPPAATVNSTPTPTPDVSNRIGILVGHWGYDSGAICSDGLREVDITLDVAQRMAAQLRSRGYEVDLLHEHDPDKPQPPLQNYQAAVLIALHVDSCIPGASGFKVSRWAFSQMPEIEDRLVKCIYDRYGAATGLARHDDSITIDMWNYYAFREVGERTPGAIIEMGFMTGDRWLLVQRPELAAKGLINSLICFLEAP